MTEFIQDLVESDYAHALVLQQWGGSPGTLDEAAIEAALHRPTNKQAYGGIVDLFDLAAAYVYGLAFAHGYVDGNKRTAWAVCMAFLGLNGYWLEGDDFDKFTSVIALVERRITEETFAAKLRTWARPLGASP